MGPIGLPGGASGGPSGLPGERLGLQGACREGVLGPRGLPEGRLGPQKACQEELQGRKVADPRNSQRVQGSAQGAVVPEAPENP